MLIGIAVIGSAGIARADIKDYEFRLVEPTVAVGKDKIVTVQLNQQDHWKSPCLTPSSLRPVSIWRRRECLKWPPRSSGEPGGAPGSYRFKAAFGMEGRWQLSLGAKVQGETGTVESKLVITAQK